MAGGKMMTVRRKLRSSLVAMAAPLYYTAEMVRDMPDDGNRYEVVYGELLVTPAPRLWHQEVVARLYVALSGYLEIEPAGHVFLSPADISWGPDTLVQPDVFVVPREQARTLDWSQVKDLLLVAEVLSPSVARIDRFTKRIEYQRRGVSVYRIVDPDERRVEVWNSGRCLSHFENDRLVWSPAGAVPAFELGLTQLFKPI